MPDDHNFSKDKTDSELILFFENDFVWEKTETAECSFTKQNKESDPEDFPDDLLTFAEENIVEEEEKEEEEKDDLFTFANETAIQETETFFQALREQDLARIQELTSNGENLDRSDAYGWTPLQIAAGTGSLEIVKFLVEHGAKMDTAKLPLFFAANSGALDLVRFLLEKFSISPFILDPDGNSLLHYAAESHSPELVRFLLKTGIQINLQGKARLTALERAARDGDFQTIRLLVEAGAEINSEGGRWSAPLSEIRNPFYHEIFLYGPPIYAAAATGRLDVVQYLAEHGADINAKDCEGRTVLHAAARAKNPNVMQLLLKLGAE